MLIAVPQDVLALEGALTRPVVLAFLTTVTVLSSEEPANDYEIVATLRVPVGVRLVVLPDT